MAKEKLSDGEAKDILRKWPNRTNEVWPPPRGRGFWLRGQPTVGLTPGPRISAPGARIFKTQPDGLWVHFNKMRSCDVVVIEHCGTIQNLNDKRSRYVPSSHSLVLCCSKAWLKEKIPVKNGLYSRRRAAGTFGKYYPKSTEFDVPIRLLRVLYSLPNALYEKWGSEHVPTGYEYYCPHSSLGSISSQKMRAFLGRMSMSSSFYNVVHKGE